MISPQVGLEQEWDLQPGAASWRVTIGDEEAAGRHFRDVSSLEIFRSPLHPATGRVFSLVCSLAPTMPAPQWAYNSGLAVVLDGTIFNQAELRDHLNIHDGFANDSDLVIAAYRKWGAGAAAHIKGQFALVIWDRDKDTILALRDRIGVYPLFYSRQGATVHFSTSIDALLRHPHVSNDLDRLTIANHLSHWWHNVDSTYFAAVKRVRPANILVVQGQQVTGTRYWDPLPPHGRVNWVKDDEVEQFSPLLEQAVSRSLQFGKAGIFLSGGLDSVSIAAVAAQIAAGREEPSPLALSVVFEHPDCNEEITQRGVAKQLGMPIETVRYGTASYGGPIRAVLELTRKWPAPIWNFYMPPYNILAKTAHDLGYKAILTGEGGDEWLTVTPTYAADLIRGLSPRKLIHLIRSQLRSYGNPPLAQIKFMLWNHGLRMLLLSYGRASRRRLLPMLPNSVQSRYGQRRKARIMAAIPAWVAPDPELRSDMVRSFEEADEKRRSGSPYIVEIRESLDHLFATVDMEENFERGRRLGIKFQQPYWDADLVDFLFRTPPEILNDGARSKGLIRNAMARSFPGLGFRRQRKVTAVAFSEQIMRNAVGVEWKALNGASTLAQMGLVQPRILHEMIRSAVAASDPKQLYRVWDVLNLETWARAQQ